MCIMVLPFHSACLPNFGAMSVNLNRVFLFTLLLLPFILSAQRPPEQPHAGKILHDIQKLNVLGSVLYIAAHPDDENTRLIAWLANGRKVRTAYLSLTRGEGGQNLIGSELGDALGVIRTQELMEARRIDGGEQFFTRAVDFGYSKTADESFAKWGKEEVLSDVVRAIRTFRPDIIITRFSHVPGGTHGHHTASAILAHEAFDLAADPNAFPDQIEEGLEIWQPKRLFHNGSTWWRKDIPELAKNDPDWFVVDVGGYDPLLGLSYTELAGRSRSMHKSQGFGAAETRGEALEYLHLEKGARPAIDDIFDGINTGWGRILGGESVGRMVDQLMRSFDPRSPVRSNDQLLAIRSAIEKLPSSLLRDRKLQQVDELLIACSGLVIEFLSSPPEIAATDAVNYQMNALVRMPEEVRIVASRSNAGPIAQHDRDLEPNVLGESKGSMRTPGNIDQPFWLDRPRGTLYDIAEPADRIKPVKANQLSITTDLQIRDQAMVGETVPMMDKWVDRVAGERIRPVYVTPVASVIPRTGIVIARGGPQDIVVEVEALTDSLTGKMNVYPPEGWMITKDMKLVDIAKRGDRQLFTFKLMPTENAKEGPVRFEFEGEKGRSDRTMHTIEYEHIMHQVWYSPAEVKLVPIDVQVAAQRVGYVKGAGDDVPQALENMGVHVDMIDPTTATPESLAQFDAIVTGIRAYNTNKDLKHLQPLLLLYVESGGTLVVQYNTTPRFFSGASDMVVDPATIGPRPFTISRGRVSVEESAPTLIDPTHPLLNHPNKITAKDFDGWVQERGLYFADEFAPHYTPLIAWNDPGEDPLAGALITMDHGKGRYIYTGISFFRQLPAGVPGAYRLFANLLTSRSLVEKDRGPKMNE